MEDNKSKTSRRTAEEGDLRAESLEKKELHKHREHWQSLDGMCSIALSEWTENLKTETMNGME